MVPGGLTKEFGLEAKKGSLATSTRLKERRGIFLQRPFKEFPWFVRTKKKPPDSHQEDPFSQVCRPFSFVRGWCFAGVENFLLEGDQEALL